MKTNYWNPTTRQYGTITEIRATGIMNGKMTAYHANYKSKSGPVTNTVCKTFEDADRIMTENGYERMGVIDESGCRRYTMTEQQLQALYKQFENFVADCTQQEYNENKAAITAVYTLIHKHINNEIYK